TRLVAAALRVGKLTEQVADFIEDLNVSARIAARRAADRRLIDRNQLVEMLQSLDRPMRARIALALVQVAMQCLDDDVAHQRAFAAAANAGDADELAERNLDVNVFQVVVRRAEYLQN